MHVPYSKMRLAIIFVCLLGGLPVSVLADQPTIQAIVTFAPQVPYQSLDQPRHGLSLILKRMNLVES